MQKKGKSLQENMHMRIGFAVDVNLQSLESLESLGSLESLKKLESLTGLDVLESLKIMEKEKSKASQTENVMLSNGGWRFREASSIHTAKQQKQQKQKQQQKQS